MHRSAPERTDAARPRRCTISGGIGSRLVAGGHDVTVLGKDASDAEAVVSDIGGGHAGRSGDPIAGDVVVLAVSYPDAQAVVEEYGDALSGKDLVDITNPVNDSFDGLVTPPDGSAAQELARAASGARRQGRQHDVRRHADRGQCRRRTARRVHRW
jgi:predicted dinucleotide-binding enzyme